MKHRRHFFAFSRYAKRRALDKGLEFDLSALGLWRIWAEQGGVCFWTGLAIDFVEGEARHPMRPSVDRLHPDKGYVPSNVVWASNFANRARGELGPREFGELMYGLGFPSRLDDPRLAALTTELEK